MLKAVILDLDGVLVKFNLDSRGIKEEVIGYFVKNGLMEGLLTTQDPFSMMRETVRSYFADRDPEWVENLLKEAEKIAVEHEVKAAGVTELLPNVRETLAALKAMGLKLGLFTYNNSKAAMMAVRRHGIDGFFDAMVCRDEVKNPKPNPIHLDAVMKGLGVSTDEVVCVGDSEMDIKPCKQRGVKIVAVTTGVRDGKFLSVLEPDYMIDDLSELLDIVKKLLGESRSGS